VTITAIVCAYNESRHLPACLYSLLAQTRPPDEILVINNASTDETGAVARAISRIRVCDSPVFGSHAVDEAAALERDVVGHASGIHLPHDAPYTPA
jgi:GT2 family glycosyltransferase